jgi:hypothetical protein
VGRPGHWLRDALVNASHHCPLLTSPGHQSLYLQVFISLCLLGWRTSHWPIVLPEHVLGR